MKLKYFLYTLIASTCIILVAWEYDNYRIKYSEQPIYEILEKRIEEPIILPRVEKYSKEKDIFTEIKELITYIIVTINSIFGMILLSRKVFTKNNKI